MELEEAIKKVRELIEFDENLVGWQCNKNGDVCRKIYLETVLNHLTKQEKMIELMAKAISSYDGQLAINQYKDRNEVKAKFEEYVEDGIYEQYFEKKAEESE